MAFKKGNIPWNIGLTKETDERVAKLGRSGKRKGRFVKGHKVWCEGKTKEDCPQLVRSDEFKMKISRALKGKKRPPFSAETRKKISIAKKKQWDNDEMNRKFSKEHKRKLSEVKMGEKNHQWIDGSSFEPYGVEFNKKLKEQIRKRDSYRCQECFRHQDELHYKSGKKYKLIIHHIDYSKKNNRPENLISLCLGCHLQTNYGREDWTSYFNQKQL